MTYDVVNQAKSFFDLSKAAQINPTQTNEPW